MEKIYFSKKNPLEEVKNRKRAIFHFFNLHDIWWLNKSKSFRDSFLDERDYFFPDGRILSLKLGIKQQKGPTFTRNFLLSKNAKNKKHFFIGLEKDHQKKLSEISKIPLKNLKSYNPPYIKDIKFPDEEVEKISKLIKKEKPDYVWIGIGCPKQDILANQLFEKTNKTKPDKFLCVGAGIDFFLGKKKEAPKIFTKLGIEWFYRLITDFNHTKKKAWRHFIALKYLDEVGVR